MTETHNTVCPQCGEVCHVLETLPKDKITCRACGEHLFTGQPISLTWDTFDHHLKANTIPVVVDFSADWCAPCKILAPQFIKACAEMEPHVRFATVDTDEEQKLAGHNGIRGFPTLVIYKAGHDVARHSGAMTARQIVEWVGKFI